MDSQPPVLLQPASQSGAVVGVAVAVVGVAAAVVGAVVAIASTVAVGATVAAFPAPDCCAGLWQLVHISTVKLVWLAGKGFILPSPWQRVQSLCTGSSMACGIAGGPPADAEVAVACGSAVAMAVGDGAAVAAAAVGGTAAVATAGRVTVGAAAAVGVAATAGAACSCRVGLWHCVHISILKLA